MVCSAYSLEDMCLKSTLCSLFLRRWDAMYVLEERVIGRRIVAQACQFPTRLYKIRWRFLATDTCLKSGRMNRGSTYFLFRNLLGAE
jgi:hypothetical protein